MRCGPFRVYAWGNSSQRLFRLSLRSWPGTGQRVLLTNLFESVDQPGIQAQGKGARPGDTTKAAKLADALDHEFPLNTMIQAYWLPTIRAAIEYDHGSVAGATEILQPTAAHESAETVQFDFGQDGATICQWSFRTSSAIRVTIVRVENASN